jgi:hypothetical protein
MPNSRWGHSVYRVFFAWGRRTRCTCPKRRTMSLGGGPYERFPKTGVSEHHSSVGKEDQ